MSNTEEQIEQEIQDKGLNAPRLTPDMIDDTIVDEYYHIIPSMALTLCVLSLKNGFTVTGETTAISVANFDEALGRKVARENARKKVWALEGYLLKEKLFQEGKK